MPSNHTTNYQLSQWAKSDQVLMEDFNADNAKIDAALKAEANVRANAVNAINATLSGMVRLTVGNYTGNGAESRTISVGFTPKAVLVLAKDDRLVGTNPTGSDPIYGGLAVMAPSGNSSTSNIKIVSGGFNVVYKNSACSNQQGKYYNYIALG